MTPTELREAIEDEYETELSRLGSSKAMYALTEGEMEGEAVLDGLAGRAHAAAETFDAWAADGTDAVLVDAFGGVAETQRDHGRALADAGSGDVTETVTPMVSTLRDHSTSPTRAGGLLGWALVTDRTYSQAVGFFVGNADPTGADRMREVREDVEDELERVEALLDTACAEDADWADAEAAASETIEAAYDHYVETLESMGVQVKPVC